MELQKQVTSLEISKRLQELGVKQDSYFKWVESNNEFSSNRHTRLQDTYAVTIPENDYYSAFTVAELGEMLPEKILYSADEEIYWLTSEGKWSISYSRQESGGSIVQLDDKVFTSTEADVRGKMLIYLIENKFISI